MPVLVMPATPGFRASKFALEANTRVFTSPFSRATQTAVLSGDRWMAEFHLPPMARAQAALWQAFLTKLRGRSGRFYAGDPTAKTPRGIATGAPKVASAGQSGSSLVTNGWTASIAGILRAGDYIEFDTIVGRELKIVTADANSNGAGEATIEIAPPIRVSPADLAVIRTANTSCVMALSEDRSDWQASAAPIFEIAFGAVEIFP